MDIWYIWYIYDIYIYVYGYIWCMERRLQNAFHCMTECRRPGSIAVFRHGIDMSCCVSNRRKRVGLGVLWEVREREEGTWSLRSQIFSMTYPTITYHLQRGAVVPCYLKNFQFFGKPHGSLGIFQLLMEWYPSARSSGAGALVWPMGPGKDPCATFPVRGSQYRRISGRCSSGPKKTCGWKIPRS